MTAPSTRSSRRSWPPGASPSSAPPGSRRDGAAGQDRSGAAFAGVLVAAVGPAAALVLDAASFGARRAACSPHRPRPGAAAATPSPARAGLPHSAARGRSLPAPRARAAGDDRHGRGHQPPRRRLRHGARAGVGAGDGRRAPARSGSLRVVQRGSRRRQPHRLERTPTGCRASRSTSWPSPSAVCPASWCWRSTSRPTSARVGPGWWRWPAGSPAGFINPILGGGHLRADPRRADGTGHLSQLRDLLVAACRSAGCSGALARAYGLSAALLAVGTAYLVATLSPLAVPAWRDLDDTRPGRAAEEPRRESDRAGCVSRGRGTRARSRARRTPRSPSRGRGSRGSTASSRRGSCPERPCGRRWRR